MLLGTRYFLLNAKMKPQLEIGQALKGRNMSMMGEANRKK
jgi:hypothetical protein